MSGDRRLLFTQATAADLLSACAAIESAGKTCYIAPVGELGQEVVAQALRRGLRVELVDALAPLAPVDGAVLVLTETDGQRLSRQLLNCLDLTSVTLIAPVTDWHCSTRPLFLVSIPKAGTHLLYRLAAALGYDAGVLLPEYAKPGTWYCLEFSNSHTVAKDFFVDSVRRAPHGNRHHPFPRSPVLFIYRHPLDVLVSESHYYQQDGQTVFAGYRPDLAPEQRMQVLARGDSLLESLGARLDGFLPWLEFDNVMPLSFEELVGQAGGGQDEARDRTLWSLLLKLQAPGNPAEIGRFLFDSGTETFRSGRIGSSACELPPTVKEQVWHEHPHVFEQLGYRRGGNPDGIPDRAEEFRRRPLRYASRRPDHSPILLEADYFGCNLVRLRDRIVAVPANAGPLNLSELPEAVLRALPAGRSLDEVKARLALGTGEWHRRRQEVTHIGTWLAGGGGDGPPAAVLALAMDDALPHYKGFNLLTVDGRHVGIRQSLGAVDPSVGLSVLAATFDPSDVIIGSRIEQVIDEIDGLTATARRSSRDAQAAAQSQSTPAELARLQDALQRLEKRCEELERRLTSLRGPGQT